MRSRNTTVGALLIVVLGVVAMTATGCARRVYARSSGTVYVQSAPPPPPATRVVVRPAAPYSNAVWVEGHYQWNGAQYVWVPGHYVQQRAGYTFVQPRWVNQGGRYVYVDGGWGRGGRVVHTYRAPAPRATVRYQGRRRGVSVGVRRRSPGVRVSGPRGGTVVVRP
ncbi:MAG: YXWGXW repeat-containing protein [Sandaracinaceae bacterium]|nr:YXWGXW repeat-containing protein [Sandaracinaceae bacterium]